MRTILFSCLTLTAMLVSAADSSTNQFLPTIPEGYSLQEYDDCGVEGRQPHVVMKDCYLWTFNTSDTDAGLKERSAVFSYKGIQAVYDQLDPAASYVLALTYASDHVYNRVQSLEANGVVLHGPYALPKAKAMRVIVKVPPEVTRDGKMTLLWKIHGEVNATVSIIELWANRPAMNGLRFGPVIGLPDGLQGQVLDVAYDPVVGSEVRVYSGGKTNPPVTTTGAEGIFALSRKEVESFAREGRIILIVRHDGQQRCHSLTITNLFFDPVHYRPLPAKTTSLEKNCLLLDGTWAINPTPTNVPRARPLNGPGWAPFKVPGQWLQQGFDVPQDKPVAVAREFVIPKVWGGDRIILRFDAVHAGTRYWLNGHELGYSENLFTPVEWDITDLAQPGQPNRLDLEMKVATVSEALSTSSSYAFHNLGGIDRSVRVFALPPTHIRQLHVNAQLDKDYRDGELRLNLVSVLASPNISGKQGSRGRSPSRIAVARPQVAGREWENGQAEPSCLGWCGAGGRAVLRRGRAVHGYASRGFGGACGQAIAVERGEAAALPADGRAAPGQQDVGTYRTEHWLPQHRDSWSASLCQRPAREAGRRVSP
jgi:hypothetical protein